MTESYGPENWRIYEAVHGLEQLEGPVARKSAASGIETELPQMVPDVARNGYDNLAFNVWHGDAELLAHLPHHLEGEPLEKGVSYVSLLELEAVFDCERYE